jgi:glycosyltransferase involved in cell wall biosynthesis
MERALMSRGDLYLFESAYSANVFRNKVGTPRGPVRIVHNGISRGEFGPVTPAADASDIVFLGEFRPVKGIDTLIDAVGGLHREGRALTATLVGDGPEAAALRERVAASGLTAAIRFMPPMPMRDALTLGRLVVLPSRAESLPYVVLEAAAAGRPLITTRVGGIPEIYGRLADGLVIAGDAGSLQQAIAAALGDMEAATTTAQALRQRVMQSFSVDAMVDSILAGYQEAIDGAPAAHRKVLLQA